MPIGTLDTVGGDLPLPVGGGAAIGAPPSDVDVLIERIPFWLSVGAETPYVRETAQYQREQVDQQPEAGEQSLAGWWTRSQMSFHFGAGLEYLDSTARPVPEDRLRYKTSRNVDPWTPGALKRLNGTTLARTAVGGEKVWVEPIEGGFIVATSSKVERWDGTTWTTLDYGSPFPIRAFAVDGANYYAANVDGVFRGDALSGTAAAVKLWELPDTDVPMVLGWVKQRLMLGHGPKVHVLEDAGATLPAALPAAKMTHPVATWGWSTFSDAPNGIVAGGYAGLTSAVYRFTVTEVNGAPTLGAGVVLMSLPVGERILSSLFYVGSLLVVGTNRGVRVCPFDAFSGGVSLGPLTVETEQPVTALGGYDRYVWAGSRVRSETSLLRIDLSAQLDEAGHYAWSPDLVFPTGTWTEAVTSIAFRADGRKVVGVTGRGTVVEDAGTNPSDAAWLQTARIRMGTVEDKHWLYGTLRGTYGDSAPIGISTAGPGDPSFTNVYVTTSSTERFALRTRSGEWVALRFDLSQGAELASYLVQALPGGMRQRMLSLPVSLFDYQRTRSCVEAGFDGWAAERLSELEQLERAGAVVTVSAPALFPESVQGVVERLVYSQTDDPGDRGRGTGGRLQIIVRVTS